MVQRFLPPGRKLHETVRRVLRMSWFDALQEQQHPEITWFTDDEREELVARLTAKYAGTPPFVPLNQQARDLCGAMLTRLRPVGEVALGPTRPSLIRQKALLFIEQNDPQHLLVALHEEVPPLLWFPAGQTFAALEEALSVYALDTASPDVRRFRRRSRGFLGTEGILEMDRETLIGHLSMHPLGESLFWGSEHDIDPWPETIETEDLSLFADGADVHMAQRDGAVWSLSFRAIASRAVITIEDHEGIFVVQVRYDPAPHSAQLRAFGAQFQLSWPDDLPLDVATLLVGLFYEDRDKLERLLTERPYELDPSGFIFNLYAYASVRWGDLGVLELLESLSDHRELEVRTAVADIAIRHGYDYLLAVMVSRERNHALRDELLERL